MIEGLALRRRLPSSPPCWDSRQHQLLAAGFRGLQVWDAFVVRGPVECADGLGRTWYEYRATVGSRRPFDRGKNADAR